MRRAAPLLLAALLTAPALPALADDVPEGQSFHYRCDGGVDVLVAYINVPAGASYAVVRHGPHLSILKAGPTGSGVRYVSVDGSKLVWHVKGPDGFLAHDNADETSIASNCTQQ